jgi:hypothetical protein
MGAQEYKIKEVLADICIHATYKDTAAKTPTFAGVTAAPSFMSSL